MPIDSRLGLLRLANMGPGGGGGGTNSGLSSKPILAVPGNLIELFVTHVQEYGPIIKICAQNDRMAAVFVERLILSYKDNFDKLMGQPKNVHQLRVGLLCCAKYDDSMYYRARILQFEQPGKVSVVFVDYGNTAVISVGNIRLLDNLGPDQALANIHDLASEYILGCIVPRKAEWEGRAIEFIKQKLYYIEFRCHIISEVCGKKILKIFINDVDFTRILITHNFGFPLPIQAHEVLINGIYGKHFTPEQFNIPPPPIPRAMPALSPVQNSVFKQEPDTSTYSSATPRFLSEMLIPGSEHLVYVSHVEDGPFSFAVQLKSVAEKALTKLMAELADHEPRPISGPLIPGSVCLGRFSEDQSLCRAIVMVVYDEKCSLYYADYGNSEILPYSEIFEVPPQYVNLKVMALRFTLANIRGQVISDDVKAFFKQLVTDKQVVIKVTPPEASPLKQYCEMFIEGRNVKQMITEKIMEEQPLTYSKLHIPIKGTKEKVLVSYVESTNCFFVQLKANKEALDTVMSCVAGHCQTGAKQLHKSKLRPGVTCCALYPVDEVWYRAQILSVDGDMAMILFVDYGNQENVPVTSLRELDKDLVTKVRTQALQCCLYGYQNAQPEQPISIQFEELTLEREFTMQVVEITSNQIPVVNLYDSQQSSIASQLVAPRANFVPASVNVQTSVKVEDDEWEEEAVPQQPITDSRRNDGFKKSFGDDSRSKSYKSRENDDERGSRFNKDEKSNNWRDKDENRTNWRNKESDESTNKWGRNGDDRGNRWGKDKDENSGSRFNKGSEDRGGSSGRKFGRTNIDYDSSGRAGGRFDKGDSPKEKWGEDNEGGGHRKNNKNAGFNKRDGSGFKRNDNRDSFKKPFEIDNKTSSWGGSKLTPRGERKALTIPESTVQVGSTELIEIVYTVSASEFYVQLSSDCDKLTALMADIATAFEADSGESLDSPKKGQFCIAKYSEDGAWYRGQIEKVDSDSVDVVFVDYGNHEQVSNENIRKITASLNSLPAQAVKCELFGCTEEDILNFAANTDSKKLKAQFVEKVFVRDSFKVVLIDEDKGVIINSAPQPDIDTAVAKMRNKEMVETHIQPGTTMRVQLSWFISPSLFYVQPLDYNPEFRAMIEKMQCVAKKGTPKRTQHLTVGDAVIARFRDDKVLYRATVKSVGFDPVVTYIDYGNCAKVEAGMVWELEPQYCTLPVQAVACTLSDIIPSGETWPNVDDYFKADEFNCTFVRELDGDRKSYAVQLVNGEKNIADQLVAEGIAIEGSVYAVQDHTDMEMELALLVGQIFLSEVTHVESYGKFYIHLLPVQVKQMLQEMDLKGKDPLPADQLVCGTLCIAKCEDQFYRCRVIDAEIPLIQLIDYGEVKQIQLEELFKLPASNFSKCPSLSIECALSVIEPLSSELEAQFKGTEKCKPYIIYVNGVQNETLQVTLYEKDGQLSPYCQTEGSSPLTVNRVTPLPLLHSHQKVTISHAGEDSIYLQKQEFSTVLSEILGNVYEFYKEIEYEDQEWRVGMYCAAKSSADEQWYRAKISALESNVTVLYIDYGNYETLPVNALRILDNSFCDQHELAFKVNFHVQWLVPVETILDITEDNVYNAVVLRNNDTEWLAELMNEEGASLTDSLVELGFVIALEDSPFKRIVEGGRFVEGSNLSVSVSHIDSPSQIWLLIVNDIEIVEELQDRLQVAAENLKPLNQPKGLFAAKFTDGMWYRAIHIADNVVRFIDYGNSDQVDLSDLKELTSDFAEPAEGYAVKCELPLEPKDGIWNNDSKQKLEDLLIDVDEELVAHILAVKESSVVADLIIGGKNVADILVDQDLAITPKKKVVAFVCHINSPSDFYIQLEGSELDLEEISEQMLLADNFEELTDISGFSDSILAAKYSLDELWYRAKIIKNIEEEITVLFVDYGNLSVATEFKLLPAELAAKPYVAKHCLLKLPAGVKQWSNAATELFEELAAGGTNPFTMVQEESEDNTIILFTTDGRSIADELKEVCSCAELVITEEKEKDTASWTRVYVTQANSPEDFYVQLETSSADLEMITERLSDISSFITIKNPAEWIGKLVAAKSSSDELWYRAKVLANNEAGITVFFVDYGNNEVVFEVRELPDDIIGLAALANHCDLELPERVSLWSSAACQKFIELVSDGNVVFEMCVFEAGQSSIVSLRLENGQEIKNILKDLCEVYLEPDDQALGIIDDLKEENLDNVKESAGDFFSVFVSHINSPNDFYVQKEGCESSLEEIANSLMNVEEFDDISLDEQGNLVGQMVASKYVLDNMWYRSKVLQFSESEVKVLFVDFGNVASVTNLKKLPQDLIERRMTAQQCSLNRPKEIDDWPESACMKFIELAGEGTVLLELRILKKCDVFNIVDLYFNEQSVTDILTKLCKPEMTSSDMAELVLDSVCGRDHMIQEVEQIMDDIISEATDQVKEAFVKQEAEALVQRIKEYEGAINSENQITGCTNTLSRYNIDEHIVPGCLLQNSTIGSDTEEMVQRSEDHILQRNEEVSDSVVKTEITNVNKELSSSDSNGGLQLECTLPITELKNCSNNESPKTPRRSNIDEHIVPGCVSQNVTINSEEEINENNIENVTVETNKEGIGSNVEAESIPESKDKSSPDYRLDCALPVSEVENLSDNKSLKTPSRSDIDEHIVPGCVSQVTPNNK